VKPQHVTCINNFSQDLSGQR